MRTLKVHVDTTKENNIQERNNTKNKTKHIPTSSADKFKKKNNKNKN